MAGVRQVSYKGKNIILIDLANCGLEDIPKTLEEAKKVVLSYPLKSVLAVTDVTGARYNKESVKILNEYAQLTAPYTKAGAVVGVTDLKRVIYNTIMAVLRKKYPIFDSVEQALAWLAEQ